MLEPSEVLEVLSAIDLRRWGLRASVVMIAAGYPGGVIMGSRALAARLGAASSGHVRQVLADLVADRVLLVVEEGAGSRGATYQLSADLCAWRRVPWRLPAELVAYRVFHGEQDRPQRLAENGFARQSIPARKPRLEGHKLPARSENFARQSIPARKAGTGDTLRASPYRRANEELPAFPDWRANEELPAFPYRRANGDAFKEESPTHVDNKTPTPRVAVAAQRAWGLRWLRGAPAKRLAALEEEHGSETLLGWLAESPSGLGPLTGLDYLAARAAGVEAAEWAPAADPVQVVEVPAAAASPTAVEARLLRSMIAGSRAAGEDPPAELLERLAAIEVHTTAPAP